MNRYPGQVKTWLWALMPAMTSALLLASCGDAVSLASTTEYELTLVNDSTLPVRISSSAAVISGSLSLGSDGTCQRTQRYRSTVDSADPQAYDSERSWRCTWARAEAEITFSWLEPDGNDLQPFPAEWLSAFFHGDRIIFSFSHVFPCLVPPCPTVQWVEVYEPVGTT